MRPRNQILKKRAPKKKAPKRPGTAKRTKKIGEDLLEQVVRLTGISSTALRKELKGILDRKKIDADQLTLEQLRLVAASYLREIMGGLLEKTQKPRPPETHH